MIFGNAIKYVLSCVLQKDLIRKIFRSNNIAYLDNFWKPLRMLRSRELLIVRIT